MTRTAVQIDEQMQASKSKDGKFLTFVFSDHVRGKDTEFEVVGWTGISVPPNKPDIIHGVVHLFGEEIRISNYSCSPGYGGAEMPQTTCIVIFKRPPPYSNCRGMLFERIEDVMRITEQYNEESSLTGMVVEITHTDELRGKWLEYDIVTVNKPLKDKQSNPEMAVV